MMFLKDLFRDKEFNSKLIFLALPITFQNVMIALVAAADALMLGNLDQDAMAAVSLATQIQFIQNVLLFSIIAGAGILGAQYWGKKDMAVLGCIFGSNIRKCLLISILFFAGCRYFPEHLMRLFASDKILIDYGAMYLKTASWSYLLSGVSQCYLGIMRVTDHATRSAVISSGAVVLNIIFNALLIFGIAGFPALGIRGAAVATVCARIIELLLCLSTGFEKNFLKLKLKEFFSFNKILEYDFWKYTLPVLGSGILWGIGFTSYTAIMGHLGRDSAAANSIAAVVRDLICCLCGGIAVGCSILIGNELGAGRLETGRKYGDKSAVLSFLSGVISAVMILLSIPLVLKLVNLTPLAREYTIGMFLILSFYMIGRCICTVVINGVFYAGGDSLFDVYSLVVCMWGIALPCAFFGAFYFHLPVLAIYACTCLDEVGKVPWVIWHYKKYKWVRNITRS